MRRTQIRQVHSGPCSSVSVCSSWLLAKGSWTFAKGNWLSDRGRDTLGPQARHARTADAERSNRRRGTMAELHLRTAKCPLRVVGAGMRAGSAFVCATMDAPIFCTLISLSCALFLQLKKSCRRSVYCGTSAGCLCCLRSPETGGFPQREGFLLFWCEEFFRFYLRSRRMASLRPASSAERM